MAAPSLSSRIGDDRQRRRAAATPSHQAARGLPSSRLFSVAFQEALNVGEVVERELNLFHRLRNQLFRLWQLVRVVGFFVAEPLEGIELVVLLLDLVESETTPSTLLGVGLSTLVSTAGLVAVALLELGEMRFSSPFRG